MRRAAALLVAALLTAPLVPGPVARAQEGDGSASLLVEDLRPRVLTAASPLQVLGRVVNDGDEVLEDVVVEVRVGTRIASRGALRVADTSELAYRTRGAPVEVAAELSPGASAPVDLRTTVRALQLGADGVYPLQLRVRERGGQVLGDARTYVPWFAATEDLDPLRVAWVVPLADQPRVDASGRFLDDDLAASLDGDGRLGRALAGGRAGERGECDPVPAAPEGEAPPPAGAPPAPDRTCAAVPVTWAVDPDLLATAEAMTGDYAVADGGGQTRPGEGQQEATAFLASLRDAVTAGDLLALPFADVDVVALTRSGAGLTAEVAAARDSGRVVAREALGVEPVETVVLPPPGPVTDAALEALATPETRAVVLDPTALVPVDDGLTATPGARAALPATAASGPLTGLVLDDGLSSLLEAPVDQGPRLAAQRFLVETAMLAAELPSRGRTVLVVPPRRGDLDPAVLGQAVRDTGRTPWTCAVALAQVAADAERCPGAAVPSYDPPRDGTLVRDTAVDALAAPLDLPPAADPLDTAAVDRVADVRAALRQFTDAVLAGGTPGATALRARYGRALLRTVSSAWREAPTPGARMTGLLEDSVEGLFGAIALSTQPVTLTSRSSRLDYTITNTLPEAVTVQVELDHPRLQVGPPVLLEVPAGSQVPYSVEVTTLTAGRFRVQAQLLDRTGAPLGPAQDFDVRSTRYGAVALALTGIATAVLLVAAGVRIARRALAR